MIATMAFADTLRALNSMKAEGVVEEYAIAGAMAIVFWTEPVPSLNRGLVDEILERHGLSF